MSETKDNSPLSVYTRFNAKEGKWQWSPNREHWFAPGYVNIQYKSGRTFSPSTEDIQLLKKLIG